MVHQVRVIADKPDYLSSLHEDSHGGRRQATPTCCLLLSMCTMLQVPAQTEIHKKKMKKKYSFLVEIFYFS